jgi:DNA modification methylase
MKNTLYFGDNLTILKDLSKEHPKGFIDLIYIDPPFFSNRNFLAAFLFLLILLILCFTNACFMS